MATTTVPFLGIILLHIARARIESLATNRQVWVEERNGRVVNHLAHKRGWRLICRVIGEEVI